MKIGFTGTQRGMTEFQKEKLVEILKLANCKEFSHGDCIGADEQANWIALFNGVRFFSIFPPDNPKKRAFVFNSRHIDSVIGRHSIKGIFQPNGKSKIEYDCEVVWMPRAPYLERNKHIVDNVSLMIACPKEFRNTLRSGTWATIRYAWHTKREITIIPPVEREE